jgi:hypothetical protein
MIEAGGRPAPAYLDGRGKDTFSTDHLQGIRFCRREDAERLLVWKVVVPPPGEVKIVGA